MKPASVLAISFFLSLSALAEPTVRFDGFGPVSVGMSKAEVSHALKQNLSQSPERNDEECEYLVPTKGFDGVLFMFSHDHLVRIDIEKGNTATVAGIRIGNSISEIRRAYPKRFAVSPHQYIPAPDGKYVTVKSPGGKHGIRFETDKGRVIAYYSGLFPQVEYVERCL